MNSQSDKLPDGLIAQLVEHYTGIAEIMGLNPERLYIWTVEKDMKTWMIIAGK